MFSKGVVGPEHFAWDDQGNLFTGLTNGTIIRIPKNGAAHIFAHTGGRPLGLKFDKQGTLIVADALIGTNLRCVKSTNIQLSHVVLLTAPNRSLVGRQERKSLHSHFYR